MNQKIVLIIVVMFIISINMNLYKLYSKGILFNKNEKKHNEKKYFKIKDENGIECKLLGEKDKFGFMNIDPNTIKANTFFKTNILIWGNSEKIVGKNLKIIGLDSLEKKCELANINISQKSRKNNINCTADEKLNMYFTESGMWKIYIYIDHELYGKTSFKVKKF